jgi:hypothetical protein
VQVLPFFRPVPEQFWQSTQTLRIQRIISPPPFADQMDDEHKGHDQ